METKGHPLVPKLNFDKIYAWREQQQLEDFQDDELEEEEEEEELLTENEKYLFDGSKIPTNASIDRKKELEQRKEEIYAALNKESLDEDQDDNELTSFKEDE